MPVFQQLVTTGRSTNLYDQMWLRIFDHKTCTETVFRHGSAYVGANVFGFQIADRTPRMDTFSDSNDANLCDLLIHTAAYKHYHIDRIYAA